MTDQHSDFGQLLQNGSLYRIMVDAVEDYAMLLLTPDGIITNWNKGAEKIKGYKAAEIIGKHFEIFYPEKDRQTGLPYKLLNEAKMHGKALHEGWRVRKDGTHFWGSILITCLHDETGGIIGYAKVTRDLTERKKSEDKLKAFTEILKQKNEELERFTHAASHDIQEPLRKIIVFGNMLQTKYSHELNEQVTDFIGRMQKSAQKMLTLTNDLLAFSHISKATMVFEQTDLNKVVDEVMRELELTIREKQVRITVEPLPVIRAYPSQMEQLFQNLILNAIKFNNKPVPEIRIEATPVLNGHYDDEKRYRITVQDNGIGFLPEYRDKIFEIFQRLHGKSEYPGTGIGLTICRKIVEAHGGTIRAESEEGKGSTFIIELPEKNVPG